MPGFLLVALLASLLYLSTAGFPEWLSVKIITKINSSGSFVLGFGTMKLSPLKMELLLDDVTLYRKKVVGPPALEARRLALNLDLIALVKDEFCMRKVVVSDGIIRPKLCSGPDAPDEIRDSGNRKLSFVVEFERCMVQGVNVVSLSSDVHIDGEKVRFANVGGTLSHADMKGDVSGEIVYDEKDRVLDGHLLTHLDPRLLIPLMNEWELTGTADFVRRFEFRKPPKCEVTFRKLNHGDGALSLDGKYAMEDSSYHGVDMIRARGKAHVELAGEKALVKVEVAELVRKEGSARTTFTADLTSRLVTFDGLSEIYAPAFFQMVGVFTNESREYFRFNGPVRIAASGVVDYGGLTNTNFKGIVQTEHLGIGPVMTEACSFNMSMVGLTTTVTDVQGKMYAGNFSGSGVFMVPLHSDSNVSYSVDVKLRDVDFKNLVASTAAELKDMKYSGGISGWVGVSGILGRGNGRTAVGQGYLSIKEGRLFTLPIFGGLTEFMTKYIPGVDFILAQTDARADFAIRNGMASSREILVEGGIITLSGEGDFHFSKDLDFKVKVKLLKKKTFLGMVVQFVTDPISELFEFKLKGSLAKPAWSPLHL